MPPASAPAQFGLGAAVVQNSYHIGRVAPYVEHLAREGMIGLAMANAGRAVAPFGGRQRVMGTNPIAWAVPRGGGQEPIALDVATAFIAEGKVRVARAKEVECPEGAIMDKDGFPSVNPNDFYNGGALKAFGAHKGSGFSILAQLVGVGLPARTRTPCSGTGAAMVRSSSPSMSQLSSSRRPSSIVSRSRRPRSGAAPRPPKSSASCCRAIRSWSPAPSASGTASPSPKAPGPPYRTSTPASVDPRNRH